MQACASRAAICPNVEAIYKPCAKKQYRNEENMEYTIKELAELSGISTRILRYYDGSVKTGLCQGKWIPYLH